MNRSIALLTAGIALVVGAAGLLISLQINWSANEALTPLSALADWRGIAGYATGLVAIPLIFLGVYGIGRNRRSAQPGSIDHALAEANRIVGFRD